jgi:hypothetical protein
VRTDDIYYLKYPHDLPWNPLESPSFVVPNLYRSAWIANRHTVGGNIMTDHTACPNNCLPTNRNTWQNGRIRSYPCTIIDYNRPAFPKTR